MRTLALAAGVAAILGLTLGCPGRLDDPDRFLTQGSGGGSGGVGGGGSGGSGGSGGGGSGGAAGCSPQNVEATVIVPSCGINGCHGPTDAAGGHIDLQSAGIADRIRMGTAGASVQCMGRTFASLFYDKIRKDPQVCGTRMPQGIPLPLAEITCIKAYLDIVLDGGTP